MLEEEERRKVSTTNFPSENRIVLFLSALNALWNFHLYERMYYGRQCLNGFPVKSHWNLHYMDATFGCVIQVNS